MFWPFIGAILRFSSSQSAPVIKSLTWKNVGVKVIKSLLVEQSCKTEIRFLSKEGTYKTLSRKKSVLNEGRDKKQCERWRDRSYCLESHPRLHCKVNEVISWRDHRSYGGRRQSQEAMSMNHP